MNLLAGTTVLIEHKTSSADIEDGSAFWKRLRLDSQSSNYLTGSKAVGFDPKAVLFDVIRKPRIKPLKATPVESRKYKKDGGLYANQRENDETPCHAHPPQSGRLDCARSFTMR